MAEIGNRFSFDKKKDNDFEVYYVLLNKPSDDVGMMLRYTLHKTPELQTSTASVEGVAWDKKNPGNNIGLIQQYPLKEMNISSDGYDLKIANSGVQQSRLYGDIGTTNQKIKWDLKIDNTNAIAVDRFPGVREYSFFPAFYSPYCKHKLNGWVEINGTKHNLDGINGSDGYYNNIQNLKSWTWGNCVNFQDDPEFMFEGISARCNTWTTPSLWLFFYWKGKRYETNIVDSMFIHQEIDSGLSRWAFVAEKDDVRFECELSADPEDMIMLAHPLPDGSALYTNITLLADMKVDIYQKQNNNKWDKVTMLHADKTATFEVTKPVKNPAVKREFCIIS